MLYSGGGLQIDLGVARRRVARILVAGVGAVRNAVCENFLVFLAQQIRLGLSRVGHGGDRRGDIGHSREGQSISRRGDIGHGRVLQDRVSAVTVRVGWDGGGRGGGIGLRGGYQIDRQRGSMLHRSNAS